MPDTLYAGGSVRGEYDPLRFVVRLHPDVQAALDGSLPGMTRRDPGAGPVLLAFSTYLHETVHWWQHVGSTAGLVLSLLGPAQTHYNREYLAHLLADVGPVKSLRAFYEAHHATPPGVDDGGHAFVAPPPSAPPPSVADRLNITLNNWHDLEFCRRLVLRGDALPHVEAVVRHPYFESVGHAYQMAWRAVVWLLSATADPGLAALADVRGWDAPLGELRARRVRGFYYGSPVDMPPIGTRAVFEGQARLAQLQYLHFASGKALDWPEFDHLGMLGPEYLAAFARFLSFAEQPTPATVADPVVALFLAACDLALNPAEGLVFGARCLNSLVSDLDPGWRLAAAARAVGTTHRRLATAVSAYSRAEYADVTETLSRALGWPSPLAAAGRVAAWPDLAPGMRAVAAEDAAFRFAPGNLPVRVFLARFLAFQRDKRDAPEFFAWPGAAFRDGPGAALGRDRALALFGRHEPLFLDAPDGEVRPRLVAGRAEAAVMDTFHAFYQGVAGYELARQWQVEPGPFAFAFDWLTPAARGDAGTEWATRVFTQAWGVEPAAFTVV